MLLLYYSCGVFTYIYPDLLLYHVKTLHSHAKQAISDRLNRSQLLSWHLKTIFTVLLWTTECDLRTFNARGGLPV